MKTMKIWRLFYQNWLILAVPLDEGWALRCLVPEQDKICSDGAVYPTPEAAIASAKERINRETATYVLASALLDLYEAGRIQEPDCHSLLSSLGYTC